MTLRRLSCALALLAPFAGATGAQAANWYVAPCGQDFWAGVNPACSAPLGPKRTIQAAINAASNGDTVFVLPGTYLGTIDLDGKAITIVGAGGAASTVLDGNGAGPVVTCNSFEGPGTVLEGLTIRDGFTNGSGAGMLIALASPTISECVFESNEARVNGGAISCSLGSPAITDCHFTQNEADNAAANPANGNGGAIWMSGGSPVLTGCTFIGNGAKYKGGAVFIGGGASPVFEDCDFELNLQYTVCLPSPDCTTSMGCAVAAVNSATAFENCTFHDNRYGARGALAVSGGTVSMAGCEFTMNRPFNYADPNIHGAALFLADGAAAEVTACVFQDNYSNSSGGAVRALGSSFVAALCGFFDNDAAGSLGGAVLATDSDIVLLACSLAGNTAHSGGGAIDAEEGVVLLQGCVFTSNSATESKGPNGGAVRLEGTQLIATSCTFDGNESSTYGGAVYWVPGEDGPTTDPNAVDVSLAECDFVDNEAYIGAGLSIFAGNARVVDCLFQGNHMPGPASGHGAGVYIGSQARARIETSAFIGNSASTSGGALGVTGTAQTVGCSFSGNTAPNGGAAAVSQNGQGLFVSCLFEGNTAMAQGGAFAVLLGANASLANCVVWGNSAPIGQGAVLNHAGSPGSLTVANCAVVANTGGGVRSDNSIAEVTVANSIVRGNVSGGQLIGWSPTVKYCNIQGGAIGQGVIDVNPMFINPAVGNFRLQAGSPCIDAGHNWALPQDAPDIDLDGNLAELVPLDFDGNPRFADTGAVVNAGCGGATVVDIGPFEALGATGPELVPGDTNEDGGVNFNDIVIVLANWGACVVPCCPGDIDGNGAVEFNDIVIILSNWG